MLFNLRLIDSKIITASFLHADYNSLQTNQCTLCTQHTAHGQLYTGTGELCVNIIENTQSSKYFPP